MDLPANVNFATNPDGFSLKQDGDIITSAQLFKNHGGHDLVLELWGRTTIVTPDGAHLEDREFQQNANMTFRDGDHYRWEVTRWVYDDAHTTESATKFYLSGDDRSATASTRI